MKENLKEVDNKLPIFINYERDKYNKNKIKKNPKDMLVGLERLKFHLTTLSRYV